MSKTFDEMLDEMLEVGEIKVGEQLSFEFNTFSDNTLNYDKSFKKMIESRSRKQKIAQAIERYNRRQLVD